MRLNKLFVGVAAITAAALAGVAQATVYDVRTDWNGANPDGVWSFRQGTSAVTNVVNNWQGLGVNAFAPSANGGNFLPAYFQANATGANTPNCGGACDWAVGDLIVHTTDGANGIGEGAANVLFTTPSAGFADISGLTWSARLLNRTQDWALLVNGVTLASGSLPGDGSNGSANPDSFSFSHIALGVGDQVELLMTQATGAPFGDFVGYDVTVSLTPNTAPPPGVPEPATWALMMMGFGGLGASLRHNRRRAALAA